MSNTAFEGRGEFIVFSEIMRMYADQGVLLTKEEIYGIITDEYGRQNVPKDRYRARRRGSSPPFYVYGALDNLVKTGFFTADAKTRLVPTHKATHFFERFNSKKRISVDGLPEEDVFNYPICGHCGIPLKMPGRLFCESCISSPGGRIIDHHFVDGRSVGMYVKVAEGSSKRPLSRAILQFKCRPYASCAKRLSDFMYDYIRDERYFLEGADILIPVPDFVERRGRAGAGGARGGRDGRVARLAKCLSERLGIPASTTILLKCRFNKKQKTLGLVGRMSNVKDAFRVAEPDAVKGKSVIIIDDITTSSSTINEASRVISNSGAREVRFFTVGRTIHQRGDMRGHG